MSEDVLAEIIGEVSELVRASATRTGKLSVSPEVAHLLEGIGGGGLDALREEVCACTKCALAESRTHVVFGEGNPNADLVFVGEAPGRNEDQQGRPFVGAAGQLLTDIIVKGMKLTRDDVFICNVLKCRPPRNRDPLPEEKAQCMPYLLRQLELIQPKVICALGRHAAQSLLKTDESTRALRGKWHSYQGIPLRVTYHPAYVVRLKDDPARERAEKAKVWEDIQHVMRFLAGKESPTNEG